MFDKFRFCGDNLAKEESEALMMAIEKEEGIYQETFDDDISHLIIKRVASRNYFSAQERKIPIVPIQWVYDSIKAKKLQDLSRYTFELFEGMVVTSTDERYAIQDKVERHGGCFERELVYDHTTCLVAQTITSEKYVTAVQWNNVLIVNKFWIQDCTRANHLLNPVDYQNYTLTDSGAYKQDKVSTTTTVSTKPDSGPITSFTESCLSLISPLENDYLTPNKTNAITREVDKLLDGYIIYLSIADQATRLRVNNILCSHGAFCIDYVLSYTNVIIADTLSDYQNVIQYLQLTESSSSSSTHRTIFDTITPSTETDYSYIPIVTTAWAFDCHHQYKIVSYDSYIWRKGLFSNIKFYIYGFKRDYDLVQKEIKQNEGLVISSLDEAMYILCPKTVDTDIYKDDRAVSVKWFKACLQSKRLLVRDATLLYRPFPRLLDKKTICLTGFGHDDKVSMESYVTALGGRLDNSVTKETFALVCQEHVKNNIKIVTAKKYGIRLVKQEWMDHLIIYKEMVNIDNYLFNEEKTEPTLKTASTTSFTAIQSEVIPSTTVELPTVPCPLVQSKLPSDSKQLSSVSPSLTHQPIKQEVKKKEILYTSFNDVMIGEKKGNKATTIQDSFQKEKEIQEISQAILTPQIQRNPAEEGQRLLNGLLSQSIHPTSEVSLLHRSLNKQCQRIRLDSSSDEDIAVIHGVESNRKSITQLDDDNVEIYRELKQKTERKAKPKTKTKPRAKTTRKPRTTKKM